MAIAFVQGTGNYVATGTTISKAFASNNTAGNLLVAAVVGYKGNDTLTISDTLGNSWQQATTITNTSAVNTTITIFYAANCKAGANTITGSYPASTAGGELHISEFSGAATTSPLDKYSGTFGSASAPTTPAVVTSQNGELIWGIVAITASTSVGTGFTLITSQDGDPSEYQIQTSAGSVSAVWGSTTGGWVALMATFAVTSTAQILKRLSLLGVGA